MKEFDKERIFNRKNHHIKLQTLTYLINCLFKKIKNTKSPLGKQTNQLIAMNEYGGFLRDKYMFYYYNGLVINHSKLDNKKAIEILLNAKNDKLIQKSDYHYFFICSNLALQYFDNKQRSYQ